MSYACISGDYEIRENYKEMLYDTTSVKFIRTVEEKQLHTKFHKFYDLLNVDQWPIWKGYKNHFELSITVIMLIIKIK